MIVFINLLAKSWKQILAVSILFFQIGFSFSQDPDDPYDLYDVATQDTELPLSDLLSPNPAAFVEATFFKVDKNSGGVNVSIPIYKIMDGDIVIPITLNYSQNSIKVENTASDVGFGWSLNYGGQVNRIQKGMSDFGKSYHKIEPISSADTKNGMYYVNYTSLNFTIDDVEADLYVYSVGNENGGFYFDENQSIQEFAQTDHKIEYNILPENTKEVYRQRVKIGTSWVIKSRMGTDISSFDITNSSGLVYGFADVEEKITNLTGGDEGYSNNNSTWYISDITSKITGKNVIYNYNTIGSNSFTNGVEYEYAPIEREGFRTNPITGVPEPNDLSQNCGPSKLFINMQSNRNIVKRISSIEFTEGTVEFIYNVTERLDLENFNSINEILIKNKDGNVIEKVVFHYDYFKDSETGEKSKLKLVSVTHQNDQGHTLSQNDFSYINENDVPKKGSLKKDIFGYYNGSAPFMRDISYNNVSYPEPLPLENSQLPTIYKYSSLPDNEQLIPFVIPELTGDVVFTGRNRSVVPEKSMNGLLKNYSLNEGGKIELEYEPNMFLFNNYTVFGPGNRIKSQIKSDGNGNEYRINFSYEKESGITSGEINVFPWMAFYCAGINQPLEVKSKPFFNLSRDFSNGFKVTYTRVVEQEDNKGQIVNYYSGKDYANDLADNWNETVLNTITEAIYTASYTKSYYPFAFTRKSFLIGKLIKEEIYEEESDIYQLIGEKNYTYNHTFDSTIQAIHHWWKGGPTGLTKEHRYVYSYAYVNQKIDQRSEEYKTINNGVVYLDNIEYHFNSQNHQNVTKITKSMNNNWIDVVEYSYLKDLVQSSGQTDLEIASSENYNQIIESISYVEDDLSNKKRVSGVVNTVQIQNNLIKPFETFILEKKDFSSYTPVGFSSSSLNKDDSYELVSEISAFDSENRIIEEKNEKSGLYSSLIYGDDKVIAVVSNAKEEEVGFSSFETEDVDQWNKTINGSYIKNEPHTGENSILIGGGSIGAGYSRWGPKQAFNPLDQNGKYVFSFWAKKQVNYPSNSGMLNYELKKLDGTSLPTSYWTDKYVEVSIDSWTYNEVIIDLKKIREENPSLTQDVQIIVRAYQTTNPLVNKGFYIDDVRFHPIDAVMASYTSIPLVGVSSMSDAKSLPNHYEYNGNNELELVKDFNGNVLTIFEKATFTSPLLNEFYYSEMNDFNFSKAKETAIINNFTNGKWICQNTSDWVSVTNLNNDLVVQVENNFTGSSRSAWLSITDCYGAIHIVAVNQSNSTGSCPIGDDLSFNFIWVNGSNFNANGDDKYIDVLTNGTWTIGASSSWITPTQVSPSVLKISASPNDDPNGDFRTGTFDLIDCQGIHHTVSVTQSWHL